MKIAFTHNLQLSDSEEEAEFDSPATVAMIVGALAALGHEVEPIEVSGPPSRVVARLEALAPDLVFNTAEGTRGRFREAFFPALFDRLELPFTGSDAYTCAVTLDKQLTKELLARHGVPSPRGVVVTRPDELGRIAAAGLAYPLIVKPNYEGSSMGIGDDAVVEDEQALGARVVDLLARFGAGVLVEEYVAGQDIVVPFLERASPATGGVLEPAAYAIAPDALAGRPYPIYDYRLKGVGSGEVGVQVPAGLPAAVRARLIELSGTVFRALGMRDVGRIDFRVLPDGDVRFIEVNALPSLEGGASIYAAAALAGLATPEAVLGCIVQSTSERFGLRLRARRERARRRGPVQVGLAFNLRRVAAGVRGSDEQAEYDSPETIAALREAIASLGHDVVELEATPELPAVLASSGVDVVFNIAEGFEGRARESHVPALLELLGIPYTGSDPTALSLALDKALAKRLVRQAGIATPDFAVLVTGRERLPRGFSFPAIVKPLAEGSSKGIIRASVVASERELRELALEVVGRYRQPVLVERFLPGREFTVALLGERRPRVLPPAEIVFTAPDERYPIYSFASKFDGEAVRIQAPALVERAIERELGRVARAVFSVLGCRDLARVDLRQAEDGRIHFIECNPLPGMAPGFSDLCLIAAAAGMDYRTLVGEILAPALRRLRERQRRRQLAVGAA